MSKLFNESEKQERDYLQTIIKRLHSVIQHADTSVKEQVQSLKEQKEYLWESKTDIDPHDVKSVRESILNTYAIGESVIARNKRLRKILNIPYFGRIDFRETKSKDVMPLYIGVHTFYDPATKTNLIYDWRAPIAGMFYDNELGKASYISPFGKVDGEISLKRQYRIRNGSMEYMIESSLTVHDDVLQRELSSNSDDKMKNIVATIQREQNHIIRNEDASVLIIQGVAGSGKTSIALHRIAYLLYRFKDTLSSKDIMIISPNKVFADYISNVLPELGEETVPESSMEQILSAVTDNKYKFQTFFEQVADLLTKPSPSLEERIRYKSSFEFIALLDKFILHVENTFFRPVDVKIKHITIPCEYLAEEFRRFHRYPVRRRFEVMTDHIIETVKVQYRIYLTTSERNALKKQIHNMFSGHNDLQLYKEFYQWAGVPEMFKLRKNRMLEYSDLAPLAYVHMALDGYKNNHQVKHLLIDEMQDYSPIQYKILLKLFPCRKTVLGDACQSVNPFGSSTAEMIRKSLVTGEIMKLCKSYRSTYEITALAQKIRPNTELEAVSRHGEVPRILKFTDKDKEEEAIRKLILDFRDSGNNSLGIICKNEQQAEKLYSKLEPCDKDIFFLSHESSAFVNGIIITSAHMSKGLEFDEVIIPYVNDANYQSEIDKSMLYVAVTRAMHRLFLTYSGTISTMIKDVSSKYLNDLF